MPIRDPDERRAYAREWMRRRREAYFTDKACETCGSDERLELHHRVMAEKENHAIWSWSQARRDVEIAKCAVLCRSCHEEVHRIAARKQAELRNPCGTYAAYKRGCRCDACKQANADYQWEKRAVPDSNRRARLCRPLPSLSVNRPSVQNDAEKTVQRGMR